MRPKPAVKPALNAEVKVSLPEDDVKEAISAFDLQMARATARDIYFFDTPGFDLSSAGLVLRARKTERQPDDVTVKLRPMKHEDVKPKWRFINGLKSEVDIVADRQVESCSLTLVVPRGEIEHVVIGSRAIQSLFAPLQFDFIGQHSKAQINPNSIEAFGPIHARIWTVKAKGSPSPVTVELWRLPNNRRLIEFSSKGPFDQAPVLQQHIDALLASKGFAAQSDGDTKTRMAVRFFTGDRSSSD